MPTRWGLTASRDPRISRRRRILGSGARTPPRRPGSCRSHGVAGSDSGARDHHLRATGRRAARGRDALDGALAARGIGELIGRARRRCPVRVLTVTSTVPPPSRRPRCHAVRDQRGAGDGDRGPIYDEGVHPADIPEPHVVVVRRYEVIPVIVTEVPPAVVPHTGETSVTVGGAELAGAAAASDRSIRARRAGEQSAARRARVRAAHRHLIRVMVKEWALPWLTDTVTTAEALTAGQHASRGGDSDRVNVTNRRVRTYGGPRRGDRTPPASAVARAVTVVAPQVRRRARPRRLWRTPSAAWP